MIELVKPARLPIPHDVLLGITTRNGGVSKGNHHALNLGFSVNDDPECVRTNRSRLFKDLDIAEANLAKPEQIHSANLAMVQEPGVYPETDALITHESNIYLTIQTADCLPVLIWTIDGEWLAAIHSGWRGTDQAIATEVLAFLLSGSGYAPHEFYVWIGPGLGPCHFQVGPEFESIFDDDYLEHRDGQLYLDNSAAVRNQILEQGIPPENLEVVNECTYCAAEKYFSHRRDNGVTGRMLAIIGRRI